MFCAPTRSRMPLATVVLPEPVPPAIPITTGGDGGDIGKIIRPGEFCRYRLAGDLPVHRDIPASSYRPPYLGTVRSGTAQKAVMWQDQIPMHQPGRVQVEWGIL